MRTGGTHTGSTPGSTTLIAEKAPPKKADCPDHVARRDKEGRLPIGDCGERCVIRRYRLGLAVWDGERWV